MAKDLLDNEESIEKLKKQCQNLEKRVADLETTIEKWGPLVNKIEEMSAIVRNLRYRLMAAVRR